MTLRVILAEKPSMGRAIAAAIGVGSNGRTHIEGKDLQGRPTVVTWGIGHLVEGCEPEEYTKDWEKWDWSALPMIPSAFKYKVVSKTKDQFDVVKAQLARATEIVVATDAGREGELIASLIFEKSTVKAQIEQGKVPTLRLWAKSLTDDAVKEAYAAMKPWSHYKGYRDAAHGRSEADWLVGMSGSRGMTNRARALGHHEKGAWPVGRVMTPTLAILVDRELEIRNFVPRDFFTLEGTFNHAAGTYTGKWFRVARGEEEAQDRFETADEARALLADLKGRPAKVTKFETRNVNKRPEQFYDLTTLQKEANKRFGFTAERTLGIVQDLYEAKVLSYPRTNSRYLTHQDAAKIPDWLAALAKLSQYKDFLGEVKNTKLDSRYVDDAEVEDHTAIMPTENAPNWGSLADDQKQIYDLVARRFIAAFYPDRVEAKTTLITEIDGAKGPESFKTTGTAVLDLGWSKVDSPSQSNLKKRGGKKKAAAVEAEDEADEKPLDLSGATLRQGDSVTVRSLDSKASKTTPPKRMTEADLLAAMQTAGKDLDEEELRAAMKECSGIGTPATRANIIEKLVNKGTAKYPKVPLVERQKNFLVPSEKGIQLIQLIPFKDLRSAELTGRWESDLEQIKNGKNTLDAFRKSIHKYTHDMIAALKTGLPGSGTTNGGSMPSDRFEPVKMDYPCPKCGKSVLLKSWEGRFYTKCDDPSKKCYFGFDADQEGKALTACVHCEGGRVKTTPSGGKVCADCGKWQDQSGASASGGGGGKAMGDCPKCHAGKLFLRKGANGPFVSCTDRVNCKFSYDAKEDGKPKGGLCKACKTGPIKVFDSGKKRCSLCGEWVNEDGGTGKKTGGKASSGGAGEDRGPRPADANCPACGERAKTVFTKRGWRYRCDGCDRWDETK